ncbi:MAG: C1 family peptidase [Pseudomonadota bacterium]
MKLNAVNKIIFSALLSITPPCFAIKSPPANDSQEISPNQAVASSLITQNEAIPADDISSETQKRSYKLIPDEDSSGLKWLLENKNVSIISPEKFYLSTYNSVFTAPPPIPAKFDVLSLDPIFPSSFTQGQQNSCTANALTGLIRFVMDMEGMPPEDLSRRFIYANERLVEGDINEDSGASLSTGIRTLCEYGVCKEELCPYDDTMVTQIPSEMAYIDALNRANLDDMRLGYIPQSLEVMKYTLSMLQRPFVLGVQIYESFESETVTQTGIIPMPQAGERWRGGHAMLAIGYNDIKQTFTIRNSWGPKWGHEGNCYLPYKFVDEKLTSDSWTIRRIGKKVQRNI